VIQPNIPPPIVITERHQNIIPDDSDARGSS
jgi:hypothetical protein